MSHMLASTHRRESLRACQENGSYCCNRAVSPNVSSKQTLRYFHSGYEYGIKRLRKRFEQAVLDVIGFYQEAREQSQDGVWEKFGNAHPQRGPSQLVNRLSPPPLPQRARPRLVVVPSTSKDNVDVPEKKPTLPARPPVSQKPSADKVDINLF